MQNKNEDEDVNGLTRPQKDNITNINNTSNIIKGFGDAKIINIFEGGTEIQNKEEYESLILENSKGEKPPMVPGMDLPPKIIGVILNEY